MLVYKFIENMIICEVIVLLYSNNLFKFFFLIPIYVQHDKNNKMSTQQFFCRFCGDFVVNEKHRTSCLFWDDGLSLKLESHLVYKNFVVLMPINEKDEILTNIYYYIIKSIKPSIYIVRVPAMNNLSKSFERLKDMGWLNHDVIRINLFILSVSSCPDKEQSFLDYMKILNDINITNGDLLFFDNWFKMNEIILLKIQEKYSLGCWLQKIFDFGMNIYGKVRSVYDFFIKHVLKNNQNHLLLGPSILMIPNEKPTLFNTIKSAGYRTRTYWCNKDKGEPRHELGINFKCDRCNLNHRTNSLSACTYCHKLFSYTNLTLHEKVNCLHRFADSADLTSVIILLISKGDDAEIRSNIFGQYLQLKHELTPTENKFLVSRFHCENEESIADILQTSRIKQLSETLKTGDEVVPIVSFFFCDKNTDLVRSGKVLFQQLPHLHTLLFSVRIQTKDIVSSFPKSDTFSCNYETSQFKFLQMLEFFYQIIINFDQKSNQIENKAADAFKVGLKTIGTSFFDTPEILVCLRLYFNHVKHRLDSKSTTFSWKDLMKNLALHFSKTKKIFANGVSEVLEQHITIIFTSFGIFKRKTNVSGIEIEVIDVPQNIEKLLSMSCPMFTKNLLTKAKN